MLENSKNLTYTENSVKIFSALSDESRAQIEALAEELCRWSYAKSKRTRRAASHRELYAPKRIFSYNTTSKNHGRRQPCRGFLSCLAEKSSALECFAVLNVSFFLQKYPADTEILDVFQGRWIFCGEKDSFKTVQIPMWGRPNVRTFYILFIIFFLILLYLCYEP